MSNINTEMIQQFVEGLGGHTNIKSVTNCMTRLRVSVNNGRLVDIPQLKAVEGVLGVINADEQIQVILGPAKANKAAELMKSYLQQSPSLQEITRETKKQIKAQQTNPIQQFF